MLTGIFSYVIFGSTISSIPEYIKPTIKLKLMPIDVADDQNNSVNLEQMC